MVAYGLPFHLEKYRHKRRDYKRTDKKREGEQIQDHPPPRIFYPVPFAEQSQRPHKQKNEIPNDNGAHISQGRGLVQTRGKVC